jgi:hypothetical protein
VQTSFNTHSTPSVVIFFQIWIIFLVGKEPTVSKRSAERREAEQYLWHMAPKWCNKFDHEHWWEKDSKEATQEAAVWEVLRRHPQTENLITEKVPLYQTSLQLEFSLKFKGLFSWPKMAEGESLYFSQKHWAESLSELPPQWGVPRYGVFEIDVIENEEIKELGKRYWDTYRPSRSHKRSDFNALRRARKIWDDSIGSRGSYGGGANFDAFNSLTLGRVLVGFDPRRPGIEKLVQRTIREIIKSAKRKGDGAERVGKSYWRDWLIIIAEFEKAEMTRIAKQKRDDQLYVRYRRIIGLNKPWPT